MKDKIERLLNKKREELKISSSKHGLRLDWVNPTNYSIYYLGERYAPDKPKEFAGFVDNILRGDEIPKVEKVKKRIEKQIKADKKAKEEKKEKLAKKKEESKSEKRRQAVHEKAKKEEKKVKPAKEKKK